MENDEINLKNLKLYCDENDRVFGYDNEENEYMMNRDGRMIPVERGSIDIMWGGCPLDYAEEIQQKLRNKAAK